MKNSPIAVTLRAWALMILSLGAVGAWANDYPLAPNPNPVGNTISIATGDVGYHDTGTFTNFGQIEVQNGGTLRNLAEFDIIADEDSGSPGTPAIDILAGGLMETVPGTQMNFDTLSRFYVLGTVVNEGNISTGWTADTGVGSQFTNFGSYQGKRATTFRGDVDNFGFLGNTATSTQAGYLQQIATRFTNHAGATLLNHGEFVNFTQLDNSGSILNDTFLSGGVGRGIFRSGGVLNNLAGGDVSNRHRWFNPGQINNEGLFTNEADSLGLANESTGQINNLAGGTFINRQTINNAGQITNAGSFQLAAFSSGGIAGGGSYLQTGGETIVDAILQAASIDFEAGFLRGNGSLDGPVHIFQPAILSPGQSAGHLDFVGNLMLDGTLEIELESSALFDSIAVDGMLDLGSQSVLDISLLGGFVPDGAVSFDLVTATAINGSFGTINLPTEIANQYRLVQIPGSGGGPTILRLTAVPEPGATGLAMLFGMAGVLSFRRRREGR